MSAPDPALVAVLDELDELRAKATPGPWFAWNRGVGWHLAIEDPTGVDHLPGRPELVPEGMRTDLARAEDAALIVAAVNAVPQLTAALRAVLPLHTNTVAYVGVGDAEIDVCSTCFDQDENPEVWPCPTVAAITTALEAS